MDHHFFIYGLSCFLELCVRNGLVSHSSRNSSLLSKACKGLSVIKMLSQAASYSGSKLEAAVRRLIWI